nr:hemerythrin domain-containing protein [Anaerobacillus alkaliphilus]
MTELRYELFTAVHKGLRYELGNISSAASSLNVEDDVSLAEFTRVFQTLSRVLHSHAEHEDSFVQPIVDKLAPALSERLEEEHTSTEEILVGLDDAIAILPQLSKEERQVAWNNWSKNYNRFFAQYLNHLQTEEVEVMEVLWQHMTDEELDEVSVKLRSSIPPEEMAVYLSYMLPAMNVYERVGMLSQMQKFAPPEAFRGVCELAKNVLAEKDWTELEQGLSIA